MFSFQDEVVAHEVPEKSRPMFFRRLLRSWSRKSTRPAGCGPRPDRTGAPAASRAWSSPPRSLHQRDPLLRLERERQVPHRPSGPNPDSGTHVLELEPAADRHRHRARARRGRDAGCNVEEGEEVGEIQTLLDTLRQRQQNALDQIRLWRNDPARKVSAPTVNRPSTVR